MQQIQKLKRIFKDIVKLEMQVQSRNSMCRDNKEILQRCKIKQH
ncbi:hypothetical protein SDC9_127263 [bioreactor metagenome]|uniref:Uncharacterized protein n=1 Tax=bioreactor metagenome TaxID=1076179 RepID=A0A645CSW5_9ZZZZ